MRHLNLTFRGSRALALAGIPALLVLTLVGSPFAQSGPPNHHGPGGPRPGMGFLGPVPPEILKDSIGVTGSKLDQYTKRYQSYMASTKPARDSLQAAMRTARAAHERGDTAAVRSQRSAIRQQAEALRKRDREFEAGLNNTLSADQQKRLAAWQENRIKLAQAKREEWHKQHGGHGYGHSPNRPDSAMTRTDSSRS